MNTDRILKPCLPFTHQFKGVLPVAVSNDKHYRLVDQNFTHYICEKCGATKK